MSSNSRKTPYYLIDLEKVKSNYNRFFSAITHIGRNDIIAYSIKANYNPAIIMLLNSFGSFFEVCSEYEYNLLYDYGIDSSRIIINGSFNTNISKYKDSIIILDSLTQVLQWKNTGCREQIGLRVNLNYFTKDERFKNQQSRFGIDINSLEFKKAINKTNLNNIICLHCHLSGNTRNPSIYHDVIEQLLHIQQTLKLGRIKYFDIGGGYKIGNDKELWNYSDYINEMNFTDLNNIQVIFEPGNCLVRDCATYHTKIIAIKSYNQTNIFVADGSSLHIPKNIQNTTIHIENTQSSNMKYTGSIIYGNTCKESDLIYKFPQEVQLGVGDEIIIEDIGAYSINEINPLILGNPKIYFTTTNQIVLGNRLFSYVCHYSDYINIQKKNNYYQTEKNANQNGLFVFINNSNEVIYIGMYYDKKVTNKKNQYFRTVLRNLKNKLTSKSIIELENSDIYIWDNNLSKQSLLFEEAYLIGLYKPKFNYL